MKILRFLGVLFGVFYFGVEHASAAVTITLDAPNARMDDYFENGQTVAGPFNGTTQIYVDRSQPAGRQIYFYKNSTQIFLPNNDGEESAIETPERFFVVNYVANCPSDANLTVAPGFVKWGFEGYFDRTTGGTQMFNNSGLFTADGEDAAISYNSNTTWHAQWSLEEYIPVQFPNVNCSGYDFVGWFDSNGNQVTYNSRCSVDDGTCTGYLPQGDITLYGQWEKSASATEDYSVYVTCSGKNTEIVLFDTLSNGEQLDMQSLQTYVNEFCKSPCGNQQMNFDIYMNSTGDTLAGPTNDSPVSSITGGANYMIGQTQYNAPTSITLVPSCEAIECNQVIFDDTTNGATYGIEENANNSLYKLSGGTEWFKNDGCTQSVSFVAGRLNTPTPTGATFVGYSDNQNGPWNLIFDGNGALVDADYNTANNPTTLYAVYCPSGYHSNQSTGTYNKTTVMCVADEYSITYNGMDGIASTNANTPSTYSYDTGATIGAPTMAAGYVFKGWCEGSTATQCETFESVVTIAADTTGDQEYSLSWACDTNNGYQLSNNSCEQIEYDVTLMCSLGASTEVLADVSFGDSYSVDSSDFTNCDTTCDEYYVYLRDSDTPLPQTITSSTVLSIGSAYEGATDITIVPACETEDIVNAKFIVHTTNLSAGSEFKFNMSATGTFTVDCGEKGLLSGPGVSEGEHTFTRSTTDEETYTCTYTVGGEKTITFDGDGATGYSTDTSVPAIAFSDDSFLHQGVSQTLTPHYIQSLEGSLTSLFPYKSGNSADGAQPRFNRTFCGATNLTSVPDTLFKDYTAGATNMFKFTFRHCSNLTNVPEDLFGGITVGQNSMFYATFYDCDALTSVPKELFNRITVGAPYLFFSTFNSSGLTSIDKDLFAGINQGQDSMFAHTFSHCSDLTFIPADLFSHITSSATSLFSGTFGNCTGLTAIPPTLFSNITTGASGLFASTFSGCTGLTAIPQTLFSNVQGSAYAMFMGTFVGCTNINSIPAELFANFTQGKNQMFDSTFEGCTGLTAIPSTLFSTITTGASRLFANTFSGCTGLESIPDNLFSNVQGSAQSMFANTFKGCTTLGEIPGGLFSQFTVVANQMFSGTFQDCTSLTAIPPTLFSNITLATGTTSGTGLFANTFNGCTNLGGYIPASTFKGLIENGSPLPNVEDSDMWLDTFTNTKVATSCSPYSMSQYITGYEGDDNSGENWNTRVSCGYSVEYDCNGGTDAPDSSVAALNINFTPAENTCERTGYTFAGWAVSDTNDVVQPNESFEWEYTSPKTLTAQWTENTYTGTYNCSSQVYQDPNTNTSIPLFLNPPQGAENNLDPIEGVHAGSIVTIKSPANCIKNTSSDLPACIADANSFFSISIAASPQWNYNDGTLHQIAPTQNWTWPVNADLTFKLNGFSHPGTTITYDCGVAGGTAPNSLNVGYTNCDFAQIAAPGECNPIANASFAGWQVDSTSEIWNTNDYVKDKSIPDTHILLTAQWECDDEGYTMVDGECVAAREIQLVTYKISPYNANGAENTTDPVPQTLYVYNGNIYSDLNMTPFTSLTSRPTYVQTVKANLDGGMCNDLQTYPDFDGNLHTHNRTFAGYYSPKPRENGIWGNAFWEPENTSTRKYIDASGNLLQAGITNATSNDYDDKWYAVWEYWDNNLPFKDMEKANNVLHGWTEYTNSAEHVRVPAHNNVIYYGRSLLAHESSLTAQWKACNWPSGAHATSYLSTPAVEDNTCKYMTECETGYMFVDSNNVRHYHGDTFADPATEGSRYCADPADANANPAYGPCVISQNDPNHTIQHNTLSACEVAKYRFTYACGTASGESQTTDVTHSNHPYTVADAPNTNWCNPGTGYVFNGWKWDHDTATYDPGDTISDWYYDQTTFTAQWECDINSGYVLNTNTGQCEEMSYQLKFDCTDSEHWQVSGNNSNPKYMSVNLGEPVQFTSEYFYCEPKSAYVNWVYPFFAWTATGNGGSSNPETPCSGAGAYVLDDYFTLNCPNNPVFPLKPRDQLITKTIKYYCISASQENPDQTQTITYENRNNVSVPDATICSNVGDHYVFQQWNNNNTGSTQAIQNQTLNPGTVNEIIWGSAYSSSFTAQWQCPPHYQYNPETGECDVSAGYMVQYQCAEGDAIYNSYLLDDLEQHTVQSVYSIKCRECETTGEFATSYDVYVGNNFTPATTNQYNPINVGDTITAGVTYGQGVTPITLRPHCPVADYHIEYQCEFGHSIYEPHDLIYGASHTVLPVQSIKCQECLATGDYATSYDVYIGDSTVPTSQIEPDDVITAGTSYNDAHNIILVPNCPAAEYTIEYKCKLTDSEPVMTYSPLAYGDTHDVVGVYSLKCADVCPYGVYDNSYSVYLGDNNTPAASGQYNPLADNATIVAGETYGESAMLVTLVPNCPADAVHMIHLRDLTTNVTSTTPPSPEDLYANSTGVYRDGVPLTNLMGLNTNPLYNIPTYDQTIATNFDGGWCDNCSADYPVADEQPHTVNLNFHAYMPRYGNELMFWDTEPGNNGKPAYINNQGYITQDGINEGQSLTDDTTWYAVWKKHTWQLPYIRMHKNNMVIQGWQTGTNSPIKPSRNNSVATGNISFYQHYALYTAQWKSCNWPTGEYATSYLATPAVEDNTCKYITECDEGYMFIDSNGVRHYHGNPFVDPATDGSRYCADPADAASGYGPCVISSAQGHTIQHDRLSSCVLAEYPIIYDCGNVAGGQQTTTISHGATHTVWNAPNWCTPSAGQEFAGWYFNKDQTVHSAGDQIANWNYADGVFTAQWNCKEGYTPSGNGCVPNQITIIYDGDCVSAINPPTDTCTYGATFTSATATTVVGYTSDQWATSVNSFGADAIVDCHFDTLGVYEGTAYAHAMCNNSEIIIDWQENGGNAIPNGSCIYDQTLTLANQPTRPGYVFNGWELANGTYVDQNVIMQNGCITTYLGPIPNNISTSITAQWCKECVPPENGSCTVDVSTPGICEYICDPGYTPTEDGVCEPDTYYITYQPNGGTPNESQIQAVQYGQDFRTLDATTFTRPNHILTQWDRVSGGNFPELNHTYMYVIETNDSVPDSLNTVLNAHWEKCICTPETGVATCDTASNNNLCVASAECAPGYENPNVTCAGTDCVASCEAATYHIYYTLNGGTNYSNAPTTYTYGVGATIGDNNQMPTRPDSVFIGWCDDAALTQNCAPVRVISTTDTGDKYFYAKWVCETGFATPDGLGCEECPPEQHYENGQCEPDTYPCVIPNATSAVHYWNPEIGAYGSCIVLECKHGYHVATNACVANDDACDVTNGTGRRTWDETLAQWGDCEVLRCNPGFEQVGNECQECPNRRIGNEIVVSTYSSGCKIASCMYQGQKYKLDTTYSMDGECVPICESDSDYTGTKEWNESRKKCVRTCNPGYKL